MKSNKKVGEKKLLIISVLFGYLGIDQFILKNKKRGILKLAAFLVSLTLIYLIDKVINFIVNFTASSISFSRTFFQFIGTNSFITQHFSRIIGLIILTFLVFVGLILTLTIFIWWIDDILKILKKE